MMQRSSRMVLPFVLLVAIAWANGQEPSTEQNTEPAKQQATEQTAPQPAESKKDKPAEEKPVEKKNDELRAAEDTTKQDQADKKEQDKMPPEKEQAAAKPKDNNDAPKAKKEQQPAEEKPPAEQAPKQEQPAEKLTEETQAETASKTDKAADTPEDDEQESAEEKETAAAKITPTLPPAWIDTVNWRSIGPANMGGRIPALAVYEADPNIWWAASASGGLLKTENNGTTFEHQFDREATVSIGDVQVAQSDPNIVWVGTGEANPRNSVSWGDGVYKSTDGGKTWKNVGLKKTFQIGRIAIHPKDPNIVYVGALGRLWGPSEDRGVYKSTDGGETWKKVLYIDEKTGIVDLQMNPKNPETLIAAAYERQRDGFDGNDPAKKFGPGSGLYITTNGGKKFTKVTKGLPKCQLGRIGISFYRKDPRNVYLVLESELIGQVPEKAGYAGITGENADLGARLTTVVEGKPADKAGLKVGDIVFKLNGKTIHSYTQLINEIDARQAGDKMKLTVSRDNEDVQVELVLGERPEPTEKEKERREEQARRRGLTPQDQARAGSKFAQSLGGQQENKQQGPNPVDYGGIYHSRDGGKSWKRINSLNPRPMYYSQIRVDPSDNNNIWVLGTSLYLSKDGGKTFRSDNTARGIHVDHHSMWIDPNNGKHVILGNDGGIHVTYDQGLHWDHLNHVAIGQFYHVTVGPRRDYSVYGGLQDNGSWGAPQRGNDGRGAINSDWIRIGGGDGFVCAVDPEDPDQIYSESQGGATGRYHLGTGERGYVRPRPPRGTRYRFNWKTPFLLSPHNSRIFYSAGNYVFRSPYKGDNLVAISPEITVTEQGTASALAESPREEGVLYVGTTDGALWNTTDGGQTWTNLYGKEEKQPDDQDQDASDQDNSAEEDPTQMASASDQQRRPTDSQGPGPRGSGFLRMLQQQDANGDGKIQLEEKPERMPDEVFQRLDANEDGAIDQDELQNARQRMRGRGGSAGNLGRTRRARPSQIVSQGDSAQQPETESAEGENPLVENDNVSGTWEGRFEMENVPEDRSALKLVMRMDSQGKVKVVYESTMVKGEGDGKFDPQKNQLSLSIDTERSLLDITGTVKAAELEGSIDVNSGEMTVPFKLKRTGDAPEEIGDSEENKETPGKSFGQLLPGPRWISSIEASRFKDGRVYVTCDGHRSDDDKPYLFVSEDYGKSWNSLLANLPDSIGSTHVIREDVQNENVLYLGTEFSIWISIDRGASWTKLNNNLPTVAVHEIAIHPTAGEIVAGTHGRSLWILDVAALRQLSAESVAAPVSLYRPQPAVKWKSQPSRGSSGTRRFVGATPPRAATIYYSLGKNARYAELTISDIEGRELTEFEGDAKAGLHKFEWDLRRVVKGASARSRRGPTVPSGKYLVTLTVDDEDYETVLVVEDDPGN
jgi:photosystem II stability/assembly factor-like uncharacterized protein